MNFYGRLGHLVGTYFEKFESWGRDDFHARKIASTMLFILLLTVCASEYSSRDRSYLTEIHFQNKYSSVKRLFKIVQLTNRKFEVGVVHIIEKNLDFGIRGVLRNKGIFISNCCKKRRPPVLSPLCE
jgi:hypothetical protein